MWRRNINANWTSTLPFNYYYLFVFSFKMGWWMSEYRDLHVWIVENCNWNDKCILTFSARRCEFGAGRELKATKHKKWENRSFNFLCHEELEQSMEESARTRERERENDKNYTQNSKKELKCAIEMSVIVIIIIWMKKNWEWQRRGARVQWASNWDWKISEEWIQALWFIHLEYTCSRAPVSSV